MSSLVILDNFVDNVYVLRTGCITLVIHEYSDIFLETAKLCAYSSYHRYADVFFALFVVSWIVFRHYCFCTKLLWSIAIYCPSQLWDDNFFHKITFAFLCVLQVCGAMIIHSRSLVCCHVEVYCVFEGDSHLLVHDDLENGSQQIGGRDIEGCPQCRRDRIGGHIGRVRGQRNEEDIVTD